MMDIEVENPMAALPNFGWKRDGLYFLVYGARPAIPCSEKAHITLV